MGSKKRKKDDSEQAQNPSTIAALMRDKPRRGRPPRAVSRQNVYVALSDDEKRLMKELASCLPAGLKRADVADVAITVLTAHMEGLRRAVAGRDREIPEGITDLESLYLLWDLSLPPKDPEERWTSVRVSPQQVIELGRAHGTLSAAFGASRSQTFGLALSLLEAYLKENPLQDTHLSLSAVRGKIMDNKL